MKIGLKDFEIRSENLTFFKKEIWKSTRWLTKLEK